MRKVTFLVRGTLFTGLFCFFNVIFMSMVYSVDLLTSYKSALSYNANYLKAIAENNAGAQKQIQGRAALLPQIGISGSITENYLNLPGAGIGIGFFHQPAVIGNITQVVFDWSLFSGYIKSKYATQMSELQLKNAKQQLITIVAQAYFDVLYAQDTLIVVRLQKSAFERQMQQAKKSFTVGTVTIADVNDAQASLDAQSAKEIQAENELLNRKTIFRNLTGLDPETIQILTADINLLTPEPNIITAWAGTAMTNNASLQVLEKKLAMAKEDISIARAGHMPTINAQAQVNYTGLGSSDYNVNANYSQLAEQTRGYVALSLNIPLYNGGAINLQVREKIANYEATEQELTANKRQVDQNIKNAFWQVGNGVQFVKAQAQALKSAKIQLKSTQLGYQVGLRTSIDLVNAQTAYAQRLLDYNKARYDYLNYSLQLKYLAGQIDEAYLKQINMNIKD